ncbi:MAG: phenylalanine--tRNA ligase subunit alpha [Actinomycetota bacterium]
MSDQERELEGLRGEGTAAIEAATTLDELREAEVRFTGRRSRLTEILRGVRDLPDASKRVIGPGGNRLRQDLEALIERRRKDLEGAAEERLLTTDVVDVTMPGRAPLRGAPNPLVAFTARIEEAFIGLGYEIAEGPEAETDRNNFQALNIPPDHPARSLMDTYYLEGPQGSTALLRTHTSPVQVRVMQSKQPPIYVICPGRVFRREEVTATNAATFHQVEALAVDEGLSFAHLRGTVQVFAEAAYGPDTKVRLVPSFYPFTEPSAELQVTCPICGGQGCSHCAYGWHGVGGCGMVDPNVFEFVGIDPERYTGFAFGMGVEKIPMKRHGIDDIRIFLEGDLRFLEQFRGMPVR